VSVTILHNQALSTPFKFYVTPKGISFEQAHIWKKSIPFATIYGAGWFNFKHKTYFPIFFYSLLSFFLFF